MDKQHIGGRYEFEGAVLVDGSTLMNVWLTRASGYDTSLWVTDGETFVPRESVLKLVRPKEE